jgi:nickel transport protein
MIRAVSPPFCAVLGCLVFCLAGWFGHVPPAHAHGMRLVAWVDGDRVCSESSFSKTFKVRDGMGVARDTAGGLLAEGKTDEAGLWCFPAPVPQDVVLAVNAGQGHRAEFLLPVKAFAGAAANPIAPAAPLASAMPPDVTPDVPGMDEPDEHEAFHNLVHEAVREELQAQLAPIRQALAQRDAAPNTSWRDTSWRDILGGLGWIVGLGGLAAWGASRRGT